MAIKIALIHPSYGRPDLACKIFEEWCSTCKNPKDIEYLVGLDSCDPKADMYPQKIMLSREYAKWGRVMIQSGDSTDSVKASYRMAKQISDTTEILFQISDDTGPIQDWDVKLIETFGICDNFKEPKSLFVGDGYWPFGTVFVHPIINRALYDKLGFILYPDYTSMFADNDFTEVCRKLNCFILAPQLVFQHRHYTKGMTPFDETYARRNNQVEFNKNQAIFLERQKRGFDL
jgi:hypothetical protein